MITIGSKVIRASDAKDLNNGLDVQIGEVVEEEDSTTGRVRVQWPGRPDKSQSYMANVPKRTWLARKNLAIVLSNRKLDQLLGL